LESIRVSVLQQIAWLLPAKYVVRRHPPRRTRVIALAHQEFQEQFRLIELPALLAIRKNRAEQSPRPRPSQKVLLIWRFFIRIAGRQHHPFHAQVHHLVKKCSYALWIGAIEKRRIRRDSKSALDRFP